ncbi:inorganic phosphate transporter [Georgenia yuyongxinii]|uniref:Inorganic phosphate transporter n=1 Tax=Georgenia yuyongxinii TaxID=2589797 RepID=A0A552WMI0_9MICO|nr:inorganic phosphate transporter [Georgenia yuyongxinii]TRW43995.1 inorganic phosphate transporter [Georgenia yuyongxinii]
MDLVLVLVVVVVTVALAFDFTNGFHDAANAIATSVSTRALTPRVALVMAAGMNLLGALLGTGVAETIGSGIITPPEGTSGLLILLAGLVGAIVWNLITWWFGLPSSSTHALIGGLAGAGVASATTVHWDVIATSVVLPMVISPLIGFALAYMVMLVVLWTFRRRPYSPTMRGFRLAQTISAAAMALGHGLQDAQKTMGVIVIALVAGGLHEGTSIPLWVKLAAAAAISLGTYAGGWRIMRTLGRRVIELDPARGFVAESVSAAVLYTTAFLLHAPVSTTHIITSAIMGVGATRRLSAVRWGVAGNIALAWLFTIPAAALMAAGLYLGVDLISG